MKLFILVGLKLLFLIKEITNKCFYFYLFFNPSDPLSTVGSLGHKAMK